MTFVLPSAPTLRHVLVIGVDGVRFGLLGAELTPVIWAFGRSGFLTPVMIDESTPTWSGPCWATLVTGCGVGEHGITGNDLTGHRLAGHPDFVTVATRAGLRTLLAVNGWRPLALAQDGGPQFAAAGRREFVPAAGPGLAAWDAADEAVTARAARILAGEGPRLSFGYLGAADVVAHALGAGAAYREAARAADQRAGRLLGALRARPGYAQEGWTVLVVTDHGHLDQGGHGGREPEVVTAWAAAAGPGVTPGGPPPLTRQTQVAPFVLAALGSRPGPG
jgi:predicted AlkP superfamily pyrophosphatase or phosphodiesterase